MSRHKQPQSTDFTISLISPHHVGNHALSRLTIFHFDIIWFHTDLDSSHSFYNSNSYKVCYYVFKIINRAHDIMFKQHSTPEKYSWV